MGMGLSVLWLKLIPRYQQSCKLVLHTDIFIFPGEKFFYNSFGISHNVLIFYDFHEDILYTEC